MTKESDYEKKRSKNIKNLTAAVHSELGLKKVRRPEMPPAKSTKQSESAQPKKRKRDTAAKESMEPPRRSSRARATPNYKEDDQFPAIEEKPKKKRAPSVSSSSSEGEISEESGWEQMNGVDPKEGKVPLAGIGSNGFGWGGPKPIRHAQTGVIRFSDKPDFTPNLTPEEVIRRGSFGGGYFRDISSGVTGTKYKDVWKELPEQWIKGLNVKTMVASKIYDKSVNQYSVDCGAKAQPTKSDPFGLKFWEDSSWIQPQDPYGWFMWYCRFFQGRRSDDDARQISRWCKLAGPKGRFRNQLCGQILKRGSTYDDTSISPVVRQTLQHWAYQLSDADFKAGVKRILKRG